MNSEPNPNAQIPPGNAQTTIDALGEGSGLFESGGFMCEYLRLRKAFYLQCLVAIKFRRSPRARWG